MIGASQTLSTEYRFLDANTPDGKWQVIHPRERNLEYFIDHYKDDFFHHHKRSSQKTSV